MEVRTIPIERVLRPSSARTLDPRTVEALAASIKEIGLISPVIAVERHVPVHGVMQPGFLLIAGNHRLEAMKSLGMKEIDARVVSGESLETELIEIDENLCRAELSAAQRTAHIKRRKQIWEALHPAPAKVPEWERDDDAEIQVAQVAPPEIGYGKPPPQKKEFAAATAEVTGESKSTINRQLAVAEALGDDLQRVEGTSLDKGVELQALAKLPEPERADLIERAQAGEQVTARKEAKKPKAPELSAGIRLQMALLHGLGRMLESAEVSCVEDLVDAINALPDREREHMADQLRDLAFVASLGGAR